MELTTVLMDYEYKHSVLHDGTVNVPLRTADNPCLAIHTAQTTQIPAGHKAIIPIRLPHKVGGTSLG